MRTIGAKEFRLHMDKVLDHVLAGEEIILKHRFKAPVTLKAVYAPSGNSKKSNSMPGLEALKKAKKLRPSPFDPNKSIEELYRESVAQKYGIDT